MKSRGFTLVELLIVIAIVAVLASLILSGVTSARAAAQKAACVSNLRQIGGAIAAYAGDHDGHIPYGPPAGMVLSMNNLYPSTGAPTSLLSLQSGEPVALGLLIDTYLARTPAVLFCPGSQPRVVAEKELAKVGHKQAQGNYYYRHGGNTKLSDPGALPPAEPPLMLGNLGLNRRGKPIRALVIDAIFQCPEEMKSYDVNSITNHDGTAANVLYTDGHVSTLANDNNRFTVDVSNNLRAAFSKILDTLEVADELQ